MKHIVPADPCRALDHGVSVQNAPIPELYFFAYDGVGTNVHPRTELCAGLHRRLQMDVRRFHFLGSSGFAAGSRSTILHIKVASAASCPSTVARPSSLQKSPRQEITFISTFNWSPGTTGRRKRAPSTATKYKSLFSRSGTSCSRSNPPVCAMDSMINTPGIIG